MKTTNYFVNHYKDISYPKETDSKNGLRNAQIGAIHSISSFFTTNSSKAAIVIMPTGSGKTSVLMMTPYVVQAKKVLVVTPSIMVRGQIKDDFCNLSTLIKANVFKRSIKKPIIYELTKKFNDSNREDLLKSNVTIATPICALSLTNEDIIKEYDLVLIDEAHHSPAKTWESILINTKHSKQVLFTATPFRLDKKEIKGEIIYNYPLSLAYRDNIFGSIQYIPIEESLEKDFLIAKKAEEIFFLDKERELDHYLMVRTGSKDAAKNLEILYKEKTNLNLRRIDSTMSYKTINNYIADLKNKLIDGIICVDMLGEGFDFPNLKIAAIHEPHKSLSNTLQFIGRFARTNSTKLGVAKFIAMNNDELIIENKSLYTSDAAWQDIIIDLSEKKISDEEINKVYLSDYVDKSGEILEDLSLHGIRLNCHARIYKVSSFNREATFPTACKIEYGPFKNNKHNTVVGIGKDKTVPKWYTSNQVRDIKNMLFIVHYQESTNLLFIYSQIRTEIMYNAIAEAFCISYERIPKYQMNKVLGNLTEFEIFNSGMQNRYNDAGESYRISAGSDVAQSIDKSSGRLYNAGHVFCKALTDSSEITIGYSSGSKMWSSAYMPLLDFIKWCEYNGSKISNEKLVVKTNTNYDFLPIPEKLKYYPNNIFMADYLWKTYSNPPEILLHGKKIGDILNLELKIGHISKYMVTIIVQYGLETDEIYIDTGSFCKPKERKFKVNIGNTLLELDEYLTNNPLIFRTTDDKSISGIELSKGYPDSIVFDIENIKEIDWIGKYRTNISLEVNNSNNMSEKSIHTSLKEILLENKDLDYIIYDHSSGEIADYITIFEKENNVEITFFHIKKMTAKNFNSSVNEVYEVAGQAVKSMIWLKTNSIFLNKINTRRRSKNSSFIRGNYSDFQNLIKSGTKQVYGNVVIVQPSIKKSHTLPLKIQEVIAASSSYISTSGKFKRLEVWGSK